MSDQIIHDIIQYGYLAIFTLILLQEVGMPNPIPNEFVLLFSGYLAFSGILNVGLVILSAIAADLLASILLYEAFYFFGNFLIGKTTRLPARLLKKVDDLSQRFNLKKPLEIGLSRLTPFIKGYVSILCGLLHLSQKKYGIILTLTSVIWSSMYVFVGYLAGPYWSRIVQSGSKQMYLVLILPFAAFFLRYIIRRLKKQPSFQNPNSLNT
jgi:membrane protein DedA with SNARE-associated domain